MATKKPDEFFDKGYPLKRSEFFHGQMPNANDFNNVVDYLRAKVRALSALLNGPGIVRGLEVQLNNCKWPKILLDIEPGMAIDRFGRDIIVPYKDTKTVVFNEGTENPVKDDVILFYLERDEAETQNVPAFGGASSCDGQCCNSRIAEGYKITGVHITKDEFEIIETENKEYYSKPDQGVSGVNGNADMWDVWKIIKHYVTRFQDSVGDTDEAGGTDGVGNRLDDLEGLKRLLDGIENDGGVLIWAVLYCTLFDNNDDEEIQNAGTLPLGDMARRNILSNDTLTQMIAEHATDYNNPHNTIEPNGKMISGRYTLSIDEVFPDNGTGIDVWEGGLFKLGPVIARSVDAVREPDTASIGTENGVRTGSLMSGVAPDGIGVTGGIKGEVLTITTSRSQSFGQLVIGPLKREGKPVSGTVTSVTTGIKISIRVNEVFKENLEIIYNKYKAEIKAPKVLTNYHYSTDSHYGYEPMFTDFFVPGIQSWLAAITNPIFVIKMVPVVKYTTNNCPGLTIKFTDNIFNTVMALNNTLNADLDDVLEGVILFDCDVTFLWTAYVTENIDMDGVGSFVSDKPAGDTKISFTIPIFHFVESS